MIIIKTEQKYKIIINNYETKIVYINCNFRVTLIVKQQTKKFTGKVNVREDLFIEWLLYSFEWWFSPPIIHKKQTALRLKRSSL